MEEAGVPPHVIDLGVLERASAGPTCITTTLRRRRTPLRAGDVVEVHRGMRAEEPRRTNVGAPPTINVKVTRQWMFEV
jgi:hypothetical protein